MSPRGLDFIRKWTANNIDVRLRYLGEGRAHMLAITCRMDACALSISLQEMEDEVGDIEVAFIRFIEGRPTIL
ncbi:hypothetical protein HB777_12560 [Mesorhizobium loti]|nr:hypothetical protein HB777_12560 [Mesorhizobium loti]